jgi:hypothetical protein
MEVDNVPVLDTGQKWRRIGEVTISVADRNIPCRCGNKASCNREHDWQFGEHDIEEY